MSNFDGGPGSGPKPGGSAGTAKNASAVESYIQQRAAAGRSKDVSAPQPASGPMSTDGPNGTSEGLPKTVEPFDKVNDAGKDCGSAMSLDAIKANAKRIGRY